jgi:hypothetical protein
VTDDARPPARADEGGSGPVPDPAARVGRLRGRIASLATPEGSFVVACRESGYRPEPVDDVRFERYDDAEAAGRLARRYRAAMRTVDPALTRYDLVVSEATGASVELASVRERTDRRRENGLPGSRQTVTLAGDGTGEWLRVENGAVVQFVGPDSLLDDEFVGRQLDASRPGRR